MDRYAESLEQAATALQVDYAHAVDTRDWELFAQVFTKDVRVEYSGMPVIDGMERWLEHFVPLHDGYRWTVHQMTNHRAEAVGEYGRATCLGEIRWVRKSRPELLNHVLCMYQDSLLHTGTRWRIAERRLTILYTETVDLSGTDIELPATVVDVARREFGDPA